MVLFLILNLILLRLSLSEPLSGPRDRFWKHHVMNRTLIVDGVNVWDPLEQCWRSHFTEGEKALISTAQTDRRVLKKVVDNFRNWTIALHIKNAMAPIHVRAVQALAGCVKKIVPGSFESRSFYVEMGLEEDDGMGGNNPTHLAPLVAMFLPEVAREMMVTLEYAYEQARWEEVQNIQHGFYRSPRKQLPKPTQVGFRASEHLTYNDFKEGLVEHTDGAETFYTLNYAFSGSQDYGGGQFYVIIHEPKGDRQIVIKPEKYDALVLLGGLYLHGVKPITWGQREMFSNELWEYPDIPFGSNLWSGNDWRMRKLIHLCKSQRQDPCNIDYGTLVEDNEFFETYVHYTVETEDEEDEFDEDTEDDDNEYEGHEDTEEDDDNEYEGHEDNEEYEEEYQGNGEEEDDEGYDEDVQGGLMMRKKQIKQVDIANRNQSNQRPEPEIPVKVNETCTDNEVPGSCSSGYSGQTPLVM